MSSLFYQWIDLIWLPVGWVLVRKEQRIKVMIFFLICMFTLRTQIQLMESIGYPTGILTLLHSALFPRGLVVYSVINAVFLGLLHYFPATKGVFLLAFMLSVYIGAFCVSMLLMAL